MEHGGGCGSDHRGESYCYRRVSFVERLLVATSELQLTLSVPAVVSAIVQSPTLPQEASFETVFYGGAPPSKLLAAEVKARWPKAGL